MWKWVAIILFLHVDIFLFAALYRGATQQAVTDYQHIENQITQEARDWKALSLIPEEYRYLVYTLCHKYEVSVPIFCALVYAESGWNHNTRGYNRDSVDIGLCQLNSKNKEMFERQFDRYSIFIPAHNLEIGVWFLGKMYSEHKSWTLALAAYNAGSTAVKQSRIPKSTRKYVMKIWTWVQTSLKDLS